MHRASEKQLDCRSLKIYSLFLPGDIGLFWIKIILSQYRAYRSFKY